MHEIRDARIGSRRRNLATRRETTVIDLACQAVHHRFPHSSTPNEEI